MLFIGIRGRKTEPRGILTAEKGARIKSMRNARNSRFEQVLRGYNSTLAAKSLLSSIERADTVISDILDIRQHSDPKHFSEYSRLLKAYSLKKDSKSIRYYKGLREFAEKNGTSHVYLNEIDKQILLARNHLKTTRNKS